MCILRRLVLRGVSDAAYGRVRREKAGGSEMTRDERVRESAIRAIVLERGSYSKPSEIRAILNDPRYIVTRRGAVKKRKIK